MCELEEAIDRLKSEGITAEEIRCALSTMVSEVKSQPAITGSLDDYLDGLSAT